MRANYVDPSELRAQIGELKREIVTLHQARDEQQRVIDRCEGSLPPPQSHERDRD